MIVNSYIKENPYIFDEYLHIKEVRLFKDYASYTNKL